jgi:O-antigen/teichoic acid export membrane protein
MLVILPITVLFISLPEVWIDLVGGSTFSEAPEVLKIVAWILPLMVISNVFGYQVLISMNKEQRYIFVALGGLITALVSFFVMIPLWGLTGAAFGTLFTEFIVASLAIILSQRLKKALYLLKFVVQYSLLLIPIYLLLIYMGSVTDSTIALCIFGPVTVLVYCAFVIYFILNEHWCFQGVYSKWLG